MPSTRVAAGLGMALCFGLAWVERAFVHMGIGLSLGETNNRLPAISKTTAYQIHDSMLKATMAWCLVVRGLARWGNSAYGRVH